MYIYKLINLLHMNINKTSIYIVYVYRIGKISIIKRKLHVTDKRNNFTSFSSYMSTLWYTCIPILFAIFFDRSFCINL